MYLNKKDIKKKKKQIKNMLTRKNQDKENEQKKYFSYTKRVLTYSILFIISMFFTVFFLQKVIHIFESDTIKYQETSNLDYKVYLKENNFYETEYLEKDMIYVANLIDKIVIDFNYYFNIAKATDINFNYDIVAKLSIIDDTEQKSYFTKDYTLISNKEHNMSNDNKYNLYEQVSIDYDYYNSLANKFKQSYGINATSTLKIYLKINKINGEDANINLNNNNIMVLSIPLSEKAINIEMEYNEINNSSYLLENGHISLVDIIFVLLFISLLSITIYLITKLLKLLSLLIENKPLYDKYVDKILNEYDRLIVENTTGPGPKIKKLNVIRINKFEELLDVRDNLKLPILYYNVVKHLKCYFYIRHEKDLYLLVVKAVDLERAANEKK